MWTQKLSIQLNLAHVVKNIKKRESWGFKTENKNSAVFDLIQYTSN